jgi:hypothetical protein
MRQAEIPRQSQMRHTRAKKRLVSIDKLKEILFVRNRLHKGNFTVLRAVGYLLNVMSRAWHLWRSCDGVTHEISWNSE